MKKIFRFLLFFLVVVVVSGANQRAAYDFSLQDVDTLKKISAWNSKEHDQIIPSSALNGKPAKMLLLGAGMIGVSIYARKKFKTD